MTIEAIKAIQMVYANSTKHDWPDDIWEAICQAIEAEKQSMKCVTSVSEVEPVALQMDVIVVNLVREGINKHRARELAEHFIKHTHPQPKQEQGEPAPTQEPVSGYIKKIEDLIKERDDARSSRDFYKRRVDALQQWQGKMRDPERTIVCDILANGETLEPAGDRYTTPQPKQEPFAYYFEEKGHSHRDDQASHWFVKCPCDGKLNGKDGLKLYTHPQPKREPLTDEQIAEISVECATVTPSDIYFARAIEAAHGIKEKNT